jgi:hypothetical protein
MSRTSDVLEPGLCHLLVCNGDGTKTRAAQIGACWSVPLFVQPQSWRLETIYRLARERRCDIDTATYRLIHCARYFNLPGASETQAYCLVVDENKRCGSGENDWRSVDSLLSSRPLLPGQREALRLATERLRNPTAAFDSFRTTLELEDWVRNAFKQSVGSELCEIAWRRRSRNDTVGRCCTSEGTRAFLKAGAHRGAEEPALAAALNMHMPGAAPGTLALNRQRGWWLAEEVAGTRVPPPCRAESYYANAILQCGYLQERLARDDGVVRMLAARRADVGALAQIAPMVVEWGIESGVFGSYGISAAQAHGVINDAITRLGELNAPEVWVHFDLASENLLQSTNGTLCFIDLEYGCLGAPILSYALLLAEAKRNGEEAANSCRDAIVSLWATPSNRWRWLESCEDLPILRILLRIFIMRLRLADYSGESLDAVCSLHRYAFVGLMPGIARFLRARNC